MPTGHSMSAEGSNIHLVYLDWDSLGWREKLRILPGDFERVFVVHVD